MSSGADLFVVCKQCGSEVSPYITECPYCGHRLRRRAPKLPREQAPRRPRRGLSRRLQWRRGEEGARAWSATHERRLRLGARAAWSARPYVTITLVALGAAGWLAWRGAWLSFGKLAVVGPLHGDWWKLLSNQFAYTNGLYAFVTLAAIAVFGWLLERRWGAALTLALVARRGRDRRARGAGGLPAAGRRRRQRGRAGAGRGLGGAGPRGCAQRGATTKATCWAPGRSRRRCWRSRSRSNRRRRAGWRASAAARSGCWSASACRGSTPSARRDRDAVRHSQISPRRSTRLTTTRRRVTEARGRGG